MIKKSVTAFAPISSGNFIIGFDILGAAMTPVVGEPLGDFVTVAQKATTFAGEQKATVDEIIIDGPYASQLPSDPKENIVFACLQRFNVALRARALTPMPVTLSLHKCLPVGSGLGSSAASVVAAFKALNLFYHHAFNDTELLILCGELEGQISGAVHYDNVAPSLLGGIQLMSDTDTLCQALPTPPWHYVLLHPGTQISTRDARGVLPKHYTIKDAVYFGQKLSNFTHALHIKNYPQAAAQLHDHLIEPYRASLIPLFEQAKISATNAGALAYSISGAGPTSLAVCDSLASATKVKSALDALYQDYADSRSWICTVDLQGAREWMDVAPCASKQQ